MHPLRVTYYYYYYVYKTHVVLLGQRLCPRGHAR